MFLHPTDQVAYNAFSTVVVDRFHKVGLNVDEQMTDWGTVVTRRASKAPPDKGGWNIFFTALNGANNFDPASQLGIRGNGADAWFGWPTAPKLEALRQAQLAVLRDRGLVTKRQRELPKRAIGEDPGPLPGGGVPAAGSAAPRSEPALWAAFVLSGDGR